MTRRTTRHPPADPVLDQVLEGLAVLGLTAVRDALEASLAQPQGQPQAQPQSRLQWLWHLLEPQVRRRVEGRFVRRYRGSRLPDKKTLCPGFDFGFQASLDKDLILELNTLRFIDQGTNILLAGMSGTGKSHIAKALALSACVANRSVLYTTSADMLTRLNASLADGSLHRALRPYVRAELLVLDEVGLEQVERQQASRCGLLQKVLLPRYDHRRATIVTSNIPWEAWGDYLGDHLGATALLDRLIHHSHIIVINGPSWRGHVHDQQAAAPRQPAPETRGPSQPKATKPSKRATPATSVGRGGANKAPASRGRRPRRASK
jgi:DNA replication protein DnaC